MPSSHAEVRTFCGLVALSPTRRPATAQLINGSPKSVGGASKTSKADLVAALKQSFEICDTAYDSLTTPRPPRRSRRPAARARAGGAGQEHDARQ